MSFVSVRFLRSETGINRSNNVCYLYAYSLFFIDAKRNGFSAYIAHCSYTYLFIDETLGTLSCEQIPSANNLSLISHANIVGFSLL